jgi:hypothetical protein
VDFFQGPGQGFQQAASWRRYATGWAARVSKIPGDFELNAPTASAAIAKIGRVAAGKPFAAAGPHLEPGLPQATLEYAATLTVAAAHAYDAVAATVAVQRQNPPRRMHHSPGGRLVEAVAGEVQ